MSKLGEFYNTIRSKGHALTLYHSQNLDQDKRVLAFFFAHKGQWFGRDNVGLKVFGSVYKDRVLPPMSVGRSLNTLMNEGYIIKSKKADAQGVYGKPQHSWCMPVTDQQQLTLF